MKQLRNFSCILELGISLASIELHYKRLESATPNFLLRTAIFRLLVIKAGCCQRQSKRLICWWHVHVVHIMPIERIYFNLVLISDCVSFCCGANWGGFHECRPYRCDATGKPNAAAMLCLGTYARMPLVLVKYWIAMKQPTDDLQANLASMWQADRYSARVCFTQLIIYCTEYLRPDSTE